MMTKNYIAAAALLAAGSTLGFAATYTWTGGAGTKDWATKENWGAAYYPQSQFDTAVIGEGYTVEWDTGSDHFGATNTITIKTGSKLTITGTENGDFQMTTLNLYGGKLSVTSTSQHFGLKPGNSSSGGSLSIDYGTITNPDAAGLLDFSGMSGKLWGNSSSISLTASVSLSGAGTGTIDLLKLASNVTGMGTISTSGITVSGAMLNSTATSVDQLSVGEYAIISSAESNGGVKVIYNIPEPSAFGLLAGLGALALVASRRRRTKRA